VRAFVISLIVLSVGCGDDGPSELEREAFRYGSSHAAIACAHEAARLSAECRPDIPACVSNTGRPYLIACLRGARERSQRSVRELCTTDFDDESYTGWVGMKCVEWDLDVEPCGTLLMELPRACAALD
jgi:hypothetical protein